MGGIRPVPRQKFPAWPDQSDSFQEFRLDFLFQIVGPAQHSLKQACFDVAFDPKNGNNLSAAKHNPLEIVAQTRYYGVNRAKMPKNKTGL